MSANTESLETISLRVAVIQKCLEDCLEVKDQQIFHLEQRIKDMEKTIQQMQVLSMMIIIYISCCFNCYGDSRCNYIGRSNYHDYQCPFYYLFIQTVNKGGRKINVMTTPAKKIKQATPNVSTKKKRKSTKMVTKNVVKGLQMSR